MLDVLAKRAPKLVDDVVPNLLLSGDVLRILRNLLHERLPIRDLWTRLEALADLSAQTKDPERLHATVACKLPVSVLCFGHGVPEDVAPATTGAILDYLLPRGSARKRSSS